jgi:aminopeptidase N
VWQWDDAAKSARVTIKQTQTVNELTPLFRAAAELEFGFGPRSTVKRIAISKAEETFHFELPERPTRVCLDPRDWLLKTLKAEKDQGELLDQLAHSSHVIARAEAIESLAEMLPDADVVAALMKAAESDPFWGVRRDAVKSLAKTNGDPVRTLLGRLARTDAKAHVRREALQALAKFPHAESRELLRAAIRDDRSYYAVADALRSLTRIDRANCESDLLAAMSRQSHQDVIFRAACDGLVEIKSTAGGSRIAERLNQKMSPNERVIAVSAMAKLKPGDATFQQQLRELLTNERTNVRRAAIDALSTTGNPQAVEWLREQRSKESRARMVKTLDAAIDKAAANKKDIDELRRELDDLRRLNQQLESRLKKLEPAK